MFLILLRFGLLRFRNLKQRHITLIQRHMPHNAAAAAFCVTDRAGIQSIDRMLSPPPRTLTCKQTSVCSPGLPFNGLHPCNPCNYMAYYSFNDPGVEG